MNACTKTIAAATLVTVLLIAAGAFLVVATGAYNVAASEAHSPFVRWFLNATQERSVAVRARSLPGPRRIQ